jgi:hypothetical protein
MHVHGKRSMSELIGALSELDDVDAVLLGGRCGPWHVADRQLAHHGQRAAIAGESAEDSVTEAALWPLVLDDEQPVSLFGGLLAGAFPNRLSG